MSFSVSRYDAFKQKHGFEASASEIVFWIKDQAMHQKNVIAYFNASDDRRNRFVVMDVAGVCDHSLSRFYCVRTCTSHLNCGWQCEIVLLRFLYISPVYDARQPLALVYFAWTGWSDGDESKVCLADATGFERPAIGRRLLGWDQYNRYRTPSRG
jgi:hypothetical protein